jgi:hypothetical protein
MGNARRSLKARVWIECSGTMELAAFLEHLRSEFGWAFAEPDPGRRYFIATYSVDFGEFKDALWDGESRARDLLAGFDGMARLVRVDVFEEGAPHLQVLNAQVAGVKAAA